jgi:hypothetical protein
VPGSDYTWTTPTTLTFLVGLKLSQTVLYNYTTSVPVGTSLAGGVSGQVQYNNSGVLNGTTIGGDATLVATTGALTVTKTSGVAFAASATTDTTNAANISSGILPVARQSYTQGGTGSVARTVTNKLQESVSVLDFGADSTGSADSTSAIQAAMTAGSGGEILIPAGTYKISTGPITVPTGTDVRFVGSAKLMHYGTGDCLSLQSVKDVTLYRPYVDLTNAGSSAKGIAIRGGWYVNFYEPRVLGGNSGQSGIYIETSASAGANFGAYMIEIHGPDLGNNNGAGVLGYGIQTAQTSSDVVQITMLNVYGGWAKNCTYGFYGRAIAGFKLYGWTHDTGTDAVNIANSSDGVLMPGEFGPCTGYGINWGSGCSAMYLIAPNLVGTAPTSGYQNNTTYTPNQWVQGAIRTYGSRSDQGYFAEYKSVFSYGGAFTEAVAAGSTTPNTVRTYVGGVGMQNTYVAGVSATGTGSKNLRGYATFAAATSVAVTFANAEPDGSYFLVVSADGGSPGGYLWTSSRSTTGFTINCSAATSATVHWHLIR